MSGPVEPDELRGEREANGAKRGRSPRSNRGGDPFADLRLDQAEMAAVRTAVRDRIRPSFHGSINEHDIEDAISDAWLALLREHLATPVDDRRAFTAEVGWRAARGIVRRVRPAPYDPLDSPALEQEDHRAPLHEQIDDRAQAARLVEALEQLDDDKLAAFHLRFIENLAHDEACERLGIAHTAYFDRIKVAKARVEGAMGLTCHVFKRRQRQLLSDYVAGIAVGRARLRAERLIAADPHAAALARELRRTHEAAAVVLPTLAFSAALENDAGGGLAALLDRIREAASGWLGRSADAGELASAPALASGGARGAGVAGAGILAKTFGGLGAANVALGCLGGGAVATIACVATGVLSLPGQGGEREAAPRGAAKERVAPPERAGREVQVAELVESRPVASTRAEPGPQPPDKSDPGDESAEPSSASQPASTLEPSTAPEVQEFGVAGAGTPVGGAPPDTDDSNGASASTVRQEFGP